MESKWLLAPNISALIGEQQRRGLIVVCHAQIPRIRSLAKRHRAAIVDYTAPPVFTGQTGD
ncbi:hypothetical protein Q0V21_01420 [Paenibacillus sp. 11B]|nr:hypothetical protein [Paenibacillus sp. 11B]